MKRSDPNGEVGAGGAPPATARRTRGRVVWRTALIVLLALVLAGTAARAALPWYIERYVNRVIDESPDYDGSVGDIDVHLWRGAYTIHDVRIMKMHRTVSVPFFESEEVDFSMNWDALAHGVARGKVLMVKPKLHFVQGPTAEETQTGVGQPWLTMIKDLYPFRIDEAEIRDGEVHFHAFHKKPPVNVYLSDVQATMSNLTNVQNLTDPLIATVHATGTAMRSGKLEYTMKLDPQSHRPNFSMALQLLDLDVTKINDMARAYGDFDFEQGRFDLAMEISSRDGFVDGYVKPLFRDVRVLGVRDLGKDDPLQLLWEALVGVVGAVFKNQPRDQFGTRISVVGDLDNPQTNILEIIGNILRNAFVRAYLPSLEGRVAPEATQAHGLKEPELRLDQGDTSK